MESDLTKLDWNPHTCSCKIEITKEETKYIGEKEVDVAVAVAHPRKKSRAAKVIDGRLVYTLQQHETVKVDRAGRELSRIEHDVTELAPPKGLRLRGKVTVPCPEHIGFSGVVQTQRVSCPRVCDCIWTELIIGEQKEGGFFGAVIEVVCPEHQDLPLAEVRDAVIAASAALPLTE